MRITHIILIFSIFLLHWTTALADDFDEEHVYKSNELYYLSIKIPEDIRRINFYASACNIYMSSLYLGNSYSLSKGKSHAIINKECAFLKEHITSIKLKYKGNEKMFQLLSMADDTAKIYHYERKY